MITYADGGAALDAVVAYVEAGLGAPPHAATFAKWKGVQVLTQDAEKPTPKFPKPQVVFSVERDEASRTFALPAARDVTIAIEVRTNEFSGGKVKAGEESSDTLVSRALASLLDESQEGVRAVMREMGFHRVQWASGREQTKAVPGAAQQHIDPHRVTFTYFRPSED